MKLTFVFFFINLLFFFDWYKPVRTGVKQQGKMDMDLCEE